MVYAGTHAHSFEQASVDLRELAEREISAQRIMRATKKIGQERHAEQEARIEAWKDLPLPARACSPRPDAPRVACVQMDGGRLQIRERVGGDGAVEESQERVASKSRKGRFWRESKVGCLLKLHSTVHAEDPCPLLPASFANLVRMAKMTGEIKRSAALPQEEVKETNSQEEEPSVREEQEATPRAGRPQVLTRNVVADRAGIEEFAAQLAARAWELGFAVAERKAFVADGQEANWTAWRKYFSHYTPIVDFVHAACYVFSAAAAGRPLDDVAAVYRQWAQWLWSGQVQELIAAVAERSQALGPPQADDPETHPRCVLAEALRYLQNQAPRMRYDEYRRQGLPITSCHVESTIKQINRRVKGTEKFWSGGGARALLQLAADYLSDSHPLHQFWRKRESQATGHRRYQMNT